MGAGKSTLVRALAAALEFTPRLERVADNSFFERYTEDPPRWALWSQLAFILGAVNELSLACEDEGTVLERPPEEMFGVFVRELSRRNALSDGDSHLLEQTFTISQRIAPPPDLLVVLRGEPGTLQMRLRQRAAVGDESYRLEDIGMWVSAYATWRATLDPDRVIDRDIDEFDLRSWSAVRRLASEIEERLPSRLGVLRPCD